MDDKARADMIANQADKQKMWEVMQSCAGQLHNYH